MARGSIGEWAFSSAQLAQAGLPALAQAVAVTAGCAAAAVSSGGGGDSGAAPAAPAVLVAAGLARARQLQRPASRRISFD